MITWLWYKLFGSDPVPARENWTWGVNVTCANCQTTVLYYFPRGKCPRPGQRCITCGLPHLTFDQDRMKRAKDIRYHQREQTWKMTWRERWQFWRGSPTTPLLSAGSTWVVPARCVKCQSVREYPYPNGLYPRTLQPRCKECGSKRSTRMYAEVLREAEDNRWYAEPNRPCSPRLLDTLDMGDMIRLEMGEVPASQEAEARAAMEIRASQDPEYIAGLRSQMFEEERREVEQAALALQDPMGMAASANVREQQEIDPAARVRDQQAELEAIRRMQDQSMQEIRDAMRRRAPDIVVLPDAVPTGDTSDPQDHNRVIQFEDEHEEGD